MRNSTIVLLVILLVVLVVAGALASNPEASEQFLVDLGLATPESAPYRTSGFLEADVIVVSGQNGGFVSRLAVPEGHMVERGDVLVELDTEVLDISRDIALAGYDAAVARKEGLEQLPRPEDVEVAEAELHLAQVALETAENLLDAARSSTSEASLREAEIALAESGVERARSGVELASAALKQLQARPAKTELDLARAALESAQTTLRQVELALERQLLVSPVSGIVTDQLLFPFEYAFPGQPVVTVSDLSFLTLTVYVPIGELGRVTVGTEAVVKVDAYPERAFVGEVTHIAAEAEFTPRSVQTPEDRVILVHAVTIQLQNPELLLKPGLPVQVEI